MVTETAPSVGRPLATLVVVSAAAFLSSLDLFIVNIAFPEIRKAFNNPGFGTMSWILNGYTVVFARSSVPRGGSEIDTDTAESSCGAWPCSRRDQPPVGCPDRSSR